MKLSLRLSSSKQCFSPEISDGQNFQLHLQSPAVFEGEFFFFMDGPFFTDEFILFRAPLAFRVKTELQHALL